MNATPPPLKRPAAHEAVQQRHDAEHLAQVMLSLGARSAYVIAATGLSNEQVRHWHLRITGRQAARGPVPYHAASVIRTRAAQAHASLFAALEQQAATGLERGVDPWRILQAFQRYLALVPEALLAQALTINDAWVIARDLRGGAATLVWCDLCQANYLDMQGSALCGCPVCALYAARVGGPRRRCARRFVARSEPVRTDP